MKLQRCDVHRHLGGSISPDTVWEIIKRTNRFEIANNLSDVRSQMVCDLTKENTFSQFLNKFSILDKITWCDWAVDLATFQICKDISRDNIDYCAISLSIDKYLRSGIWSSQTIIEFIYNKFQTYSKHFDIQVDLLLALPYHASKQSQIDASNIIDSELHNLFIGLDLVGDEAFIDIDFYRDIVDRWRNRDKLVRAHVGELPSQSYNVTLTLDNLNITNIAHGIFATDYDLERAIDIGICFDLALYSNLYTGAVKDISLHPIKDMINKGCMITLSTDDPVQFNSTLDDEFNLAINNGLIDDKYIDIIRFNAINRFKPIKSIVK